MSTAYDDEQRAHEAGIGSAHDEPPPEVIEQDAYERYLSEPCDECERTATHNQGGRTVCNTHLDNSPSAPRAFARND